MKQRSTLLLLIALVVGGCRESTQVSPTAGTSSTTASAALPSSSPSREVDAPLFDASAEAERVDGGAGEPHLTVERDPNRTPWIELHTVIAMGQDTFDIDDDGSAYFSANGGSRPTQWRGHIDRGASQHIEDVIRANRFCELANSEKTHHLKSSMSISLRGMGCYVTLSIPTWKTNPRARAVYRAVRTLMDGTCGDKCRAPSSLREP